MRKDLHPDEQIVNDLAAKLGQEMYAAIQRTAGLLLPPIVEHPRASHMLLLALVSRVITRLIKLHMLDHTGIEKAAGNNKVESAIWFSAFLMARMAINPSGNPIAIALKDLEHWKKSGADFGELPSLDLQNYEAVRAVLNAGERRVHS